jgi:hypothetical protein
VIVLKIKVPSQYAKKGKKSDISEEVIMGGFVPGYRYVFGRNVKQHGYSFFEEKYKNITFTTISHEPQNDYLQWIYNGCILTALIR